MKGFSKFFIIPAYVSAVLMTSCVNEPFSSEEAYAGGEISALDEQAAYVKASLELIDAVEEYFAESVGQVDDKECLYDVKAQMEALMSVKEGLIAHVSFLGNGISRLEGTLATLEWQKELAMAAGALEESISVLESEGLKTSVEALCESSCTWIGKPFSAYFPVFHAQARISYQSKGLNQTIYDQKNSVEGLLSDIEAGLRGEDNADELYSLSDDITGNYHEAEEMVTMISEIAEDVEQVCVNAVKSALTTGEYDSASLKSVSRSASIAVKSTTTALDELIARVAACEAAIEEILRRLDDLEASLDVIQSVTFLPEYSSDCAVAYYALQTSLITDPSSPYAGYCERKPAGTLELNYLVRPAIAATALKEAYDAGTASVNVIGYYAESISLSSMSSSDDINFEVTDVRLTDAAQGLITVSASHDLDNEFYFKGIGAKCALSIVSGKTDVTSMFTDLVPKDISSDVYVEDLKLSVSDITIDYGQTYSLIATVSPSDATDASVSWSSADTEVVTVDENGRLTAVGSGTARITATTKGVNEWGLSISAFCDVTVREAVRLSGPAYVEMYKTAVMELDLPEDMVVADKTWWVENGSFGAAASVDENGVVTPSACYYVEGTKSYDTVVIKCQVNETVLSHEMIIIAQQPEGVRIASLADDDNEAILKLGNKLDLSASILPESVAGSGMFRIVYQSDAKGLGIAEMNGSGVVTPKSPGTTYMYVEIRSQEGYYYLAPGTDVIRRSVKVKVEPYWVTGVQFSRSSYEIMPGGTMTVTPSYTSDVEGVQPSYTELSWTSSDTDVAVVDESTGLITAIADGTCVITATTSGKWSVPEGSNPVSGSFSLTVKASSIYAEPGWYVYKDGTCKAEYADDGSNPVVGVVVSATNVAAADSRLAADYPGCSNGIAVGLREYSSALGAVTVQDGSGHTENYLYHFLNNRGIEADDTETVINGYALTEAYAEYRMIYTDKLAMFDADTGVAATADAEVTTPDGASSFYVPSYYEMSLMYRNLASINASLSRAGGVQLDGYYWSSSFLRDHSYDSYGYHDMAVSAFNMSSGTWDTTKNASATVYPVRVVFAF